MSCDLDLLDALVHGELRPASAAAVATHVAGCPSCARELRFLSAEREAFQQRAVNPPALPHVRKAVMDAVRSNERKTPRYGLFGALAFSASVLLVALLPTGPGPRHASTDDGNFCAAPYSAMCEDVPQGPSFTRALHSGGELVAETEDGFHACLLASPLSGAGRPDACE